MRWINQVNIWKLPVSYISEKPQKFINAGEVECHISKIEPFWGNSLCLSYIMETAITKNVPWNSVILPVVFSRYSAVLLRWSFCIITFFYFYYFVILAGFFFLKVFANVKILNKNGFWMVLCCTVHVFSSHFSDLEYSRVWKMLVDFTENPRHSVSLAKAVLLILTSSTVLPTQPHCGTVQFYYPSNLKRNSSWG